MNNQTSGHFCHQNESFTDVDYILEQGGLQTRQIFKLSENSSPFLQAVAARMQKANSFNEIQKNVLAESSRLQNFLVHQAKKFNRHKFIFASAYKNEGASSVVLNIAKAFEISGQGRLLIIDANVKTPGLTRFLGGKGLGYGLLDLLSDDAESNGVLQKLAGAEIYFLNHGRKRRDTHNLITYSRLKQHLAKLETLFDFILVDVPPLELYSDGYIWGRLVDGLILVVHANQTPLQAIKSIKEKIKNLDIQILGTILNSRRYSVPKFMYEWL